MATIPSNGNYEVVFIRNNRRNNTRLAKLESIPYFEDDKITRVQLFESCIVDRRTLSIDNRVRSYKPYDIDLESKDEIFRIPTLSNKSDRIDFKELTRYYEDNIKNSYLVLRDIYKAKCIDEIENVTFSDIVERLKKSGLLERDDVAKGFDKLEVTGIIKDDYRNVIEDVYPRPIKIDDNLMGYAKQLYLATNQ